MNTFAKISLSAALALFLSACDKPTAPNPAERNETPPTAAADTADNEENKAAKAEQATTEEAKTEQAKETKNDTTIAKEPNRGEQDYFTFLKWQQGQEQALNTAIENARAKLSEKQKTDRNLMQETINKALLSQIDHIQTSAQTLDIQDEEVKALKDKMMQVVVLGAEMIVEGEKMEKNPTQEAHKAFADLQTKLNQLAEEGKALEDRLREKYTPELIKPTLPTETPAQETSQNDTPPAAEEKTEQASQADTPPTEQPAAAEPAPTQENAPATDTDAATPATSQ